MASLPTLPQPPYYAVVFTSIKRPIADAERYAQVSARTEELAPQYPGYLGIVSVRQADDLGVTVSYWQSLDAIAAWRQDPEHLDAKARGRSDWYACYRIEICRVERAHSFPPLHT